MTTQLLFANNAAGTLASPITNAQTTFTLNGSAASLFPVPGAGQAFYGTFTDAATQTLIEIVLVTANSGGVLTCTRAQDGTPALSWNAGDIFSQRVVRAELQGFENAALGNFAATPVAITPSTTMGIVGTTLGDNAQAGSVGEFLTNTGGTAASQLTYQNYGTITLSPGDWDVWGSASWQFLTLQTAQLIGAGISLNSAAAPSTLLGSTSQFYLNIAVNNGNTFLIPTPVVRLNLTVSTPVYLVGQVGSTGGSITAQGIVNARRLR